MHTPMTAMATILLAIAPSPAAAASPSLILAAESRSIIWNGVAVAGGQVFVSGPHWAGSQGPAVARLDNEGRAVPYPDAAWNNWREGEDPGHAFVNVNSIHLDGKGSLWAVDTGSPDFGGNALPGGAKLVGIDLATAKVARIIPLGPDVVLPGSYVDDVRFHGDFAYSTDAGQPGIIVVDLKTGAKRRSLENIPATTAPADRPIVVDGETLKAPDGKPLRVQTDPMEVSPDGKWFYFGTLAGPWSRIETRWLDDFSASPETVASKVESWADIPPTGGTAMDANGDFYFSDLAANSVKRRTPDGKITTLVQDKRLHWVDALEIDDQHRLWLPVPQLDRAAIFHGGIEWPIRLFRVQLPGSS
jgi:sugar lactone lactonase YvrE